jgi:DNA-binding transcriptional regulator YhcF (GntR family)
MHPFQSGMNMMEFFIEKHSSVPVIRQIQEQIRLAVAMGIVRDGDGLPSIREVARQTGVNRGQVHRAHQSLSRSDLLVMTRGHGKGDVISMSAASPNLINAKSWRLSKDFVSRAHQLGLSATAFARYMTRQAQEIERRTPFIAYVDLRKTIAARRAGEISQLWQVPVSGLTIEELKTAVGKGSGLRKALTNHLMRDYVKSLLRSKRIEVIPIEIRYTDQTIKELGRIKPRSSVIRILPPSFLPSAPFIIARFQKLIKPPRVEISSISVSDVCFEELLRNSQYDYIIAGPAILDDIAPEILRNRCIVALRMQLDAGSLEAARIRAGVIV